MPGGGVMVLGHDFHSRTRYDKSFALGGEPRNVPTWRNLLELLGAAGVEPKNCFFTNLYMGLRSGRRTTGVFPGASDAQFRRHRQDFFLSQLSVQRPRLVITLGIHVPPVIGDLSDQLEPWVDKRGIKHLDAVGARKTSVQFRGRTRPMRGTITACSI